MKFTFHLEKSTKNFRISIELYKYFELKQNLVSNQTQKYLKLK